MNLFGKTERNFSLYGLEFKRLTIDDRERFESLKSDDDIGWDLYYPFIYYMGFVREKNTMRGWCDIGGCMCVFDINPVKKTVELVVEPVGPEKKRARAFVKAVRLAQKSKSLFKMTSLYNSELIKPFLFPKRDDQYLEKVPAQQQQ